MEGNKKIIIYDFYLEMLGVYDLELYVTKDEDGKEIFKIKDLQGDNFSGIEDMEFDNLFDTINALDPFHNDYIFGSLEDRLESNEIITKEDFELTTSRFLASDKIAKVLEEITPEKYKSMIKDTQKNMTNELIKILDAEKEYPNEITKEDLRINLYVETYFRENNIKDLMDYGADRDEGLNKLSILYRELLQNLNMEFLDIYTEDGISDGKYVTTIIFKNETKIELDTSAWNGIEVVENNIKSVYEFNQKNKEISVENDKEIDYDFE